MEATGSQTSVLVQVQMLTLLHFNMWLQTYFDHTESNVILAGDKTFKELMNAAMRHNRQRISGTNNWKVFCYEFCVPLNYVVCP